MIIYQGIQLVFDHVKYYLAQISGWFQSIEWRALIDMLPTPYIPFVYGILMILLSMAAVGLIKKLSFFMG